MTDLLGKRTEPSFWAGARGLGVSLGAHLLWAWRVGLRAHFSNRIIFNFKFHCGFKFKIYLFIFYIKMTLFEFGLKFDLEFELEEFLFNNQNKIQIWICI